MDVVDPDVSPGAVREEPLHHHLPPRSRRGKRERERKRREVKS